jgi:sirohydrochlorin cobaltochelatase
LAANDALLLISHGSARYPDAGGTMQRHADQLRASKRFAQVEIALLNGSPTVAEALQRIDAPLIRVVPYFMEDGYFSRIAVPKALGDRVVAICPPIGTHDAMAGVIERQALAACDRLGIKSHAAAVVVIGHGSSSAPGQAFALHRHSSRIAATELFARVEPACLEEAPLVAGTLAALRTHPVVVIGFFANQGTHVRDDVPALLAAEQTARGDAGLAVMFYGCVTDDPAMTEIILDQVDSSH